MKLKITTLGSEIGAMPRSEGELYCALEGGRDCGEKAKKRSAYLSVRSGFALL